MSPQDPISQILLEYPSIVLDGALATELERRGANLNDPLWSAKVLLESPQLIRQVHLDYFRAGADCAISASYQATIEGFMRRGLSLAQASDLITLSVKLALEARDVFWGQGQPARPKPFVAASVGPYGAYLADGSEYRGDYGLSLEELSLFHRPRIELLLQAGAEILACETLPSLLEAQAILRVLQDFPSAWAWFCFSARDAECISDGTPFAHCAAYLDSHNQVAAIGINCTPPQHIASLVAIAKRHSHKPIVVYPNSGEVYQAHSHSWSGVAEQALAKTARAWVDAGACGIGGCCRTTPEDIRSICQALGYER
jgi:homocysteine S-methyltransferase